MRSHVGAPQLMLLVCTLAALRPGLAQAPAAPPGLDPAGGEQLLWGDDFVALDPATWTLEQGDGSAAGIPGWGNNELQCYTPDSAAVVPNPDSPGDGLLRIRAARSAELAPCANGARSPPSQRQWTSARLSTRGSRAFAPALAAGGVCTPVALEARVRFAGRRGLWGAFWALGAQGAWPACGELDVVEHVNQDEHVWGTLHYAAPGTGAHAQQPQEPANRMRVGGGGSPAGWHTYRLEWGCDWVRWLVDGAPRQQVDRAQLGGDGGGAWAPFEQPFYLVLNMAVGGNLPGVGADGADPAGGDMLVDYVRVLALPGAAYVRGLSGGALQGAAAAGVPGLQLPAEAAMGQ